jgi:hypothetical protein
MFMGENDSGISWCYHFVRMKTVLLFTLLSLATGSFAACPDEDSIVKKVSFENTAGLTSEQKSTLNKLLMDRCFYQADGDQLSDAVYRQLHSYGYDKAYVQNPIVRVLNRSIHPSPVSVAIDFVLDYQNGTRRK